MSPTVDMAQAALLRYQLERPVGGSGVSSVDVIAVDLASSDGLQGLGFSYVLGGSGEVALRACRELLERYVRGRPLTHPEALDREMEASLSRSGRGPSFIAMAAVDVAAWDLYAKSLGVPVGVAMGGAPRPVPVYGSGGFNTRQSAEEAAENARVYVARGATAVKPRVAGIAKDAAVLRAVAEAVAGRAELMLDANEKCSPSRARWLMEQAREYGTLFVEEPLPARDLDGYRRLAAASPVAVATGEHLQGLSEFLPFISGDACSIIQPDLAMAGGLTQSLRVARLAEAFGVEVAPHFLPGLFAHLAAASPSVSWLEDFPLLEPLFEARHEFDQDGYLSIGDAPGLGFNWAAGAREAFELPL